MILCLLELARLGNSLGIEPPSLVSLEAEIEKEEQKEKKGPPAARPPTEPPGGKHGKKGRQADKLDEEVRL